MKYISLQSLSSVLRNTLAATAVTLATIPAAFADGNDGYSAGLQKFLAEPTSFVAISEGAPGPVTFASMMGNTLAVQFSIPTHSGDAFGQVVGQIDADGVFTGNGVLIREDGRGRAAPLTMIFQDDGTIVADVKGSSIGSGFMPTVIFYGS